MLLALRLGAIGNVRLHSFKAPVLPRKRMRVVPLRDERPIRLITANVMGLTGCMRGCSDGHSSGKGV